MPTILVNGITLAYETHGSGQPLVLISGLGYDRWQWHKMVPGLAEHFTVITFDNRGVGQTDKPAGPYTAQLLADDTAGLIAALGYSRAHVMGHRLCECDAPDGGQRARVEAGCVRRLGDRDPALAPARHHDRRIVRDL